MSTADRARLVLPPSSARARVVQPALNGSATFVVRERRSDDPGSGRERGHWSHPSFGDQLLSARLWGRHGRQRDMVLHWVEPGWFVGDQLAAIYAAFDEGAQARQAGIRCYCNECILPANLAQNEWKRIAYGQRRIAELTADGIGEEDAHKRVAEEISRGMAL